MAQTSNDTGHIWTGVARALGAEPRELKTIKGVSGIEHHVDFIAVDDKGSRVLLIASEPNPRMAALMQVDVQGTMPSAKVLVARPILFDLGSIARQIVSTLGASEIDIVEAAKILKAQQLAGTDFARDEMQRMMRPFIAPALRAFQQITPSVVTQIVDVLQQVRHLNFRDLFSEEEGGRQTKFSLSRLSEIDNLSADRRLGICAMPLYELNDADWETLSAATDLELVRSKLRDLGIYQYFFPSADQLALGLLDRGMSDEYSIIETIRNSPLQGHPLGDREIVKDEIPIPELLSQLQGLGYVAEGEHGYELSPAGRTTRTTIKFRPREGVVSKLLGRFSFNMNASISPKDLT